MSDTAPVDRSRFLRAAHRAGIADAPALALWTELYDQPAPVRSEPFATQAALSRLVQTLLYAGVLLVIGAFGWWEAEIHSSLGWGGVLALTLVFQAGFAVAGVLLRRRGYFQIGGVLTAVTVFATPLAVYAAETLLGFRFHRSYAEFYPWVSQGWMVMELVSIAVGAAVFAWWRHPFLLLPTLLFAYFLAMDGTAHATGADSFTTLGRVVGVYAAVCFAAAVALDYQGLRRFAFWPHVFAMLASTWAIGALVGDPRGTLVVAGALGLAVGVWLGRVTYLVGGGILAWIGVSLMVPSAPTLILSGLGMIGVAIWLATSNSPLRRWLATRTLPAPER